MKKYHREFGNIKEYKINTEKSATFIYTNRAENKTPFTTVTTNTQEQNLKLCKTFEKNFSTLIQNPEAIKPKFAYFATIKKLVPSQTKKFHQQSQDTQ